MNTPEHKPDDGLELPIEIYASDYKRLTRRPSGKNARQARILADALWLYARALKELTKEVVE
jgi:hypothetical protein